MKQRTWLDKQLENSRNAVGAWSEQKRAALKAQISGSAGVYRSNDPKDPSGENGGRDQPSRKTA
jgi:hypothetical protein